MLLLNEYYVLAYVAVMCAAIGQLFLKLGTTKSSKKIYGFRFNTWTMLGLASMGCSVAFSVQSMQVVPLRDIAAIIPMTYVLVPILSRAVLKEPLTQQTVIGTAVIILGMTIFNFKILPLI